MQLISFHILMVAMISIFYQHVGSREFSFCLTVQPIVSCDTAASDWNLEHNWYSLHLIDIGTVPDQ